MASCVPGDSGRTVEFIADGRHRAPRRSNKPFPQNSGPLPNGPTRNFMQEFTCLPVTLIIRVVSMHNGGAMDMSELRDLVLNAHGVTRWKSGRTIEGNMSITG